MRSLVTKCKIMFFLLILCICGFAVPVYATQPENNDALVEDTEIDEPETDEPETEANDEPEVDESEEDEPEEGESEEDEPEEGESEEDEIEEDEPQIIDLKKSGYKVKLKEKITFVFTGKSLKPEVCVTKSGIELPRIDADGTVNYTISYKNNKEPGKATVVVKGKGNYTGTIQTTFKIVLGTTKVSTSTAEKNIFLRWDKVKGASGYKIYRSISKKSGYKLVKTISSNKTRKYTDTKRSYYKTYYYKIRAYRVVNGKNVYGEYSKPIKNQIASLSAKVERVSSKTLKVSWEKLAGASGYVVYRSTSKSGEYKKIAKINNASTTFYDDLKVKVAVRYYYKIKAYKIIDNKKYYSAYSKAASKYTLPDKVEITAESTYTANAVVLKWKMLSYASGYEIHRSTSANGDYTKVKTIKDASTISWTQSKLDQTKDYYYKIRAFCTVNGQKIYGGFSEIYTKLRGGWRYVNGYKLYYDENGNLVTDVRNLIGPQDTYVIKVNRKQSCVTVYAADGNNGYILPVTSFICSAGYATPLGTFYTPVKYRWRELMGPCWGQWDTRIVGGILFHSVYYNRYNDNMSLSVSAYNKLGTIASHGCIRLTAGDAKWIYDNCKLYTQVTIYDSDDVAPLGKPTAYILPSWHTWDPTDPTAIYRCHQIGCHY